MSEQAPGDPARGAPDTGEPTLSPESSVLIPRQRGGLGRGLGALIPKATGGLLEVDVARISPSPQQPRQAHDDPAIGELVDSIRQHGVLQPLIVTRGPGEDYVLVAGERRWRAAREAGLRTVPAIVKEATPRQRLELALVENLQRQDLNPLETAQAYRQLVEEHGLTQDSVAERVGKSRAAVANALRLLRLPGPARDALASAAISEGHARAILACADQRDQEALLEEIVEQGLSVRQTEELARRGARGSGASSQGPRVGDQGPEVRGQEQVRFAGSGARERGFQSPDIAALEERFRQALGTKVQLYRGRRGGRLVVHFYSDDELQGLYEAICGGQ